MVKSMSILDIIEGTIARGELDLPPFSDIAMRLQEMAQSDNFDVGEIENLILSDQALAASVLRAANAPFYGGLAEITSVRNAVVRLGIRDVVNLVVLSTERDKYSVRNEQLGALLKPLWVHTVGCALASQWLAKKLGYTEQTTEAFMAGLLHDVGKLVLLRALDDVHSSGELPELPPGGVIEELLESAHPSQGHRLAETWNLPESYCRVILEHHQEQIDPAATVMILVRLANKACHKLGLGLKRDETIVLSATEEANCLGAKDVLLAELEIMLEDTPQLAG